MRCIDASTYNPQRPGRRSTSPNRATNTSPTQHPRPGSALLGWVMDDAEYIATQIQTLADARKRRPTAANRAHPDAGESQEESDHAERQ